MSNPLILFHHPDQLSQPTVSDRCIVVQEDDKVTGGMLRGEKHDLSVTVTLPEPKFQWDEIPIADPMDTAPLPLAWDTLEGPDDMPAHVKSSMIGNSLTIPISGGRLCLGTWQGIYLCEHRNRAGCRRLVVTIQGDEG